MELIAVPAVAVAEVESLVSLMVTLAQQVLAVAEPGELAAVIMARTQLFMEPELVAAEAAPLVAKEVGVLEVLELLLLLI